MPPLELVTNELLLIGSAKTLRVCFVFAESLNHIRFSDLKTLGNTHLIKIGY